MMIDDYINKLERYVHELENRVYELKKSIVVREAKASELESHQTAKAINALRALMQREIIKKDERIKDLENKYSELLFSIAKKYPDALRNETTREYFRHAETFQKSIPAGATNRRD